MRTFLAFLLFVPLLFTACTTDSADSNTVEDVNQRTAEGTDPGIDRLNAAIAAAPDQADLYASRAQMWYEKNSYDNAVADLQVALSIDSNNLNYHYLLTDVYLEYTQSRLALKTIQRAVALDPDNVESLLTLTEVQLILTQYESALESLNEVTRVEPRNPDAYLLLGHTFAELGDTARAINATQEAVEIDPDMMDGWISLGQLHAAIGSELASRYFETAMRLDSNDIRAVHARADFVRDQGDLEEAIRLYRRTSSLDRQYVAGHFNAGLLLMEQEDWAAAEEEFNITIQNDPIHIRSYFFRGYAAELQGKLAEAKRDYQAAIRFAPDYELALQGLARLGG